MKVRPLDPAELPEWAVLRAELWPEETSDALEADGRTALAADPPLTVLVAEIDGALAGFIEFGFRSVAEGCATSPVPYVEGWYVREASRRRGIGGALMRAVEDWCRERGYVEFGSDTQADNRLGQVAHTALGFEPVERLVVFRKVL